MYREGDLVELTVVYVRLGRVVEIFNISHARTALPDDEVVAQFLREHYREGGVGSALIPEEIIVPVLPEGAEGVAEWLSERRAQVLVAAGEKPLGRASLHCPQRGARKKLLDLARENAAHAFLEKRRAKEDIEQRLLSVQEKLRLPRLPRRIECCDISHLGGEATVGSVVALKNGTPDKKQYKAYRVRSVSDGDDYQAMFEVLSRRFRRGKEAMDAASVEQDSAEKKDVDGELPVEEGNHNDPWLLPDLFVVDGGRGQLQVAQTAAADLGLLDLPLVGLAKERETALGEKMVDRVYLPGQKNPIPLRPNTPELFMLARARDEAHRFANMHRKKIGKKRRFTSQLDQIAGIGPKSRTALLSHLGSVEGIKQATDEEILQVPGISQRQLRALREALGTLELSSPERAAPAHSVDPTSVSTPPQDKI
jgi:excinuclease ABC subunit C